MTRKVYQTRFGGPDSDDPGNCWAACVATMLGIPLERVPEALRLEKDADKRWDAYQRFLSTFNLRAISLSVPSEHLDDYWEALGDALVHVAGPSPRDPSWNHGVIYCGGKLWHDPHPSGDGISGIAEIEFWVPLDPALAWGQE